MDKIEINFVKIHPDAILPECNNTTPQTGDSGYDLFCVEKTLVPAKTSAVIPIGIKVGYITPGYWFRIEARSGLSFKYGLLPHPGIIDVGYRGDLGVKMYNHSDKDFYFVPGDKVAQIIVYELLQPKVGWIDTPTETIRGEKGFGSSDKQTKN